LIHGVLPLAILYNDALWDVGLWDQFVHFNLFSTGFFLTSLLTFRASADTTLTLRCILHLTLAVTTARRLSSRSLPVSQSTPFLPNAAIETPRPAVEWSLAASNLLDRRHSDNH